MEIKEFREMVKECLKDIEEFTTTDLKEMLKDKGCIYNVDYNMYTFHNTMTYLKKNSYIVPTGIKGRYRVVKERMKKDEKTNLNQELDLKEMRRKVKECIKKDYMELENILDEEKPSVYGRNKRTYEDIVELIEYMRKFSFTIKD